MANTYTPNTKIRKGNDLMIFIGGKSVAFATSHQLSTTLESETIQSKDSGYDGVNIPKSITWEITSENLFIDGEYSKLFEKQLKKEYVDIVFGIGKRAGSAPGNGTTPETALQPNNPQDASSAIYWTYETNAPYYTGKALITSLSVSASAGETATYSATFQGSGSIGMWDPTSSDLVYPGDAASPASGGDAMSGV